MTYRNVIKVFGTVLIMIFIISGITAYASGYTDLPDSLKEKLRSTVLLYVGSSNAYTNGTQVYVDTSNPKVSPVVIEGRTLVPIRFISESFKAEVGWNDKANMATINTGDKQIEIVLGEKEIIVNFIKTPIDVPAQIINNRTFLPLRALAESLGKEVYYKEGLIIIGDEKNINDILSDESEIGKIIGLFDISRSDLTFVSHINNEVYLSTWDVKKEKLNLKAEKICKVVSPPKDYENGYGGYWLQWDRTKPFELKIQDDMKLDEIQILDLNPKFHVTKTGAADIEDNNDFEFNVKNGDKLYISSPYGTNKLIIQINNVNKSEAKEVDFGESGVYRIIDAYETDEGINILVEIGNSGVYSSIARVTLKGNVIQKEIFDVKVNIVGAGSNFIRFDNELFIQSYDAIHVLDLDTKKLMDEDYKEIINRIAKYGEEMPGGDGCPQADVYKHEDFMVFTVWSDIVDFEFTEYVLVTKDKKILGGLYIKDGYVYIYDSDKVVDQIAVPKTEFSVLGL